MQNTHHSNHPLGFWAVNYLTPASMLCILKPTVDQASWSFVFPYEHKDSIGRLLCALYWGLPYISHNLCVESNTCSSLLFSGHGIRCSMCGLNEKEIGLCIWKQIGTFCCSNWSRHCINIPQAKYLFSVQCQIEPSIIIVYPWVGISPKRRFLLLGCTYDCYFHYLVRILTHRLLLESFRCCEELCLSGPFCALFPSLHLHKKSGSLQALKSTQLFF